ncbi:50S ribosomal protein L18 [bacterium M21]|nr:50S ribosomal protein L18 [bacterium M21]
MANLSRKAQRVKRHQRLRRKISGTQQRPRMSVYTSDKHIYVQFIDDVAGQTLTAMSTLDKEAREGNIKGNVEGATSIGRIAAERAKAAGIEVVVFDRGGFNFHGRVKAVADAAREVGLKF